jgi:hypothetical protein
MGSSYVSDAALDAALANARITPAVNSRRLFTKEESAADAELHQRCALKITRAHTHKMQALNTREHIP